MNRRTNSNRNDTNIFSNIIYNLVLNVFLHAFPTQYINFSSTKNLANSFVYFKILKFFENVFNIAIYVKRFYHLFKNKYLMKYLLYIRLYFILLI